MLRQLTYFYMAYFVGIEVPAGCYMLFFSSKKTTPEEYSSGKITLDHIITIIWTVKVKNGTIAVQKPYVWNMDISKTVK